jgi:hypothetical protein
MIAEANRIANTLNLDEELPITKTNLTFKWFIPAGKTYGPLGGIETRKYAYAMDVKDGGVVCSSVLRKGYEDFLAAQKQFVWPISRYDTNHAFRLATNWLTAAGFDVDSLNRDCYVKIDWLGERSWTGSHFFPHYIVCWHQRSETFHVPKGTDVAVVEFIEPLKRPRTVRVSYSAPRSGYHLRKPVETVDFIALLTPENSREAVLAELDMATNYVSRIVDLQRGGADESLLRKIWSGYTNAPFPTNVLLKTNAPAAVP